MFSPRGVSIVPVSAASISARPSEESGRKIARISAEMNLSPGQFVIQAAEAIIAMIEAPEPCEPKLVRALRILRRHKATFADKERALGDVKVFYETVNSAPTVVAEEVPEAGSENGRKSRAKR